MANFYYNDDHTAIAVLVSYGYGAGWSTWSPYKEIAYDRRVVEAFLKWKAEAPDDLEDHMEDEDEVSWYDILIVYIKKALENMGINPDNLYMGGVEGLDLEWVPLGKLFQIHEYDGAESLVIFDESDWTRAE